MSVANQVIIIFAGVNGLMDDVEISQVEDYEKGLIEFLSSNKSKL